MFTNRCYLQVLVIAQPSTRENLEPRGLELLLLAISG